MYCIKIASYTYSMLLYKIKVSVVLHSPYPGLLQIYTTCSRTDCPTMDYLVHSQSAVHGNIQSPMPVAMYKCTCMPI